MFQGQVYQLAAASELYHRDWRYHKADAVWLTRSVYVGMKEQTSEYETGSYNIFDPVQWRKVSYFKFSVLIFEILGPKGNKIGVQNVGRKACSA